MATTDTQSGRSTRGLLHLVSTTPVVISAISFLVGQRDVALGEACQIATTSSSADSHEYFLIVGQRKFAHPGEFFQTIDTLIAHASNQLYAEPHHCEDAVFALLKNHRSMLEALHISCQIAKSWTEEFITQRSARSEYLAALHADISALTLSGDQVQRGRDCDVRQILMRAFEAPVLRAIASKTMSSILGESNARLLHEQRALAGQFLTCYRHIQVSPELKRLASTVFTSSTTTSLVASSGLRPRTPLISSSETVPAQKPLPRELIDRLLAHEGASEASRLTPHDFETLRTITGLSLDTFRGINERLRIRAISDPWARAALLELARAPHDASVTAAARVGMLGSLVSEARRIGKLSPELETEIYATSAEIPEAAHKEASNSEEAA